jgi:tetratricopeptide (TPR) repeat protein
MEFEVTFVIEPSGPFGVPQDGALVCPAEPGKLYGPTIHSGSGTVVGYGTLSVYRDAADALDVQLDLEQARVRIHDNYVFIKCEALSAGEAYDKAMNLVGRILQHLSLSQGLLFSARPLILESADRKLYPVPKYIDMMKVTMYDLSKLAHDIEQAGQYQTLSDEVLARALEYFEQALLIFQSRQQIAPILSRQHSLLIASVFLNLWKAVSIIVGDPSKDKDYQRRYKELGFDYAYFQGKIERLRNLRNDYDVAHYSIAEDDIGQIEAAYGEAVRITTEVLQRYRDHLMEMANTGKR